MDNAQKAIMIGVGLFITIIIIAAVMLITGMGQDMLQEGQAQVSNISKSLQAQLTSDFEDSTVTGAEVTTAIKRYYKDETMVLIVKNGNTVTNYGKVTATVSNDYTTTSVTSNNYTPTGVGAMNDSTAAGTYVPSTAKYKSNVIKIAGSDNVVGLYFEK